MTRKVSFLIAWFIALMVNAQMAGTQKYEIQSGETLYSIARRYNVTVAKLQELNPGIETDHIMAGQKINVPVSINNVETPAPAQSAQATHADGTQATPVPTRPKYKTTHKVQKKETIYGISRQYGITEDALMAANPNLKNGKLKKGTNLNIPYTPEEDRKFYDEVKLAEEEASKPKVQKFHTIKVAVILPFSRFERNMTPEAQKMANLYQGFLLAVDSLKRHGYSVDVYAYDDACDDAVLSNHLASATMKDMQLIVGPVRQAHVAQVAKFAHENDIIHVVPLSNSLSLVNEHPSMFQVNVSYSLIYSQVYNRFVTMHKSDNIIFVEMNDPGDNVEYINGFKKALDEFAIPYQRVNVNEFSRVNEMLKTGGNNVLIPTSGSSAAFDNLCKRLESIHLASDKPVQLFGFPEWQTLSAKQAKKLALYRCQFYTSFFSNQSSARTRQFNSLFAKWFHQEQYNSFPRYGEMGYDIGAYFIKGLKDYGSAFRENIHSYSYSSLEFPFNFEKKNSWSGYQNRSLLIVTYRPDGSVVVK